MSMAGIAKCARRITTITIYVIKVINAS